MFLASGLSVAAAALTLLTRLGRHEASAEAKLTRADRYFSILEVVLLIAFFVSLGAIGSHFLQPRWLALWVIVLIGILVPLVLQFSARRAPAMLAAVTGLRPRQASLAYWVVVAELVAGSWNGSASDSKIAVRPSIARTKSSSSSAPARPAMFPPPGSW